MPQSDASVPFRASDTPAGSRAWRAKWRRLSPLARHLTLILVVKAVLLALIWSAFFRAPTAHRMTMDPASVAQRMLPPAPLAERPHAVR